MLDGKIGQVLGPFDAGVDLLDDQAPIGVFVPGTARPVLFKLGIQAEEGTQVLINNASVKIGKTGIYELDNIVKITSLIFVDETNTSTLVDFVY